MSDWYYDIVWHICAPGISVSSRPVVLHPERIRRPGAFILAANHLTPYDVPCLMRNSKRRLDFVSITEVFRNPLVGWFYRNMNAFPLDRGRVDTGTTRTILDRLKRGRVVALFPEGGIRREEDSILNGGRFKPGVLRLARLANVPIVPAVVVGARAYHRPASWLPLRRTRYGIHFGQAIEPGSAERPEQLEQQLRAAYLTLHRELLEAMGK